MLSPVLVAAVMALSSLGVTANVVRLRRRHPEAQSNSSKHGHRFCIFPWDRGLP
jgi:hypothetical protein